jgi:hypothetical protein
MSQPAPLMDAWLAGNQRGAKRLREAAVVDGQRHECAEMMRSGDWSAAGPAHLVALFAMLFERVYGVPCGEVAGPARFYAAKMVGGLLRDEFGGDPGAVAAYLRWAWEQEAGRERWRREHHRDGGHLSYRWVLQAGRTLDEYRLSLARRR